ncbi:death on curing protein, Doc toxin [Vibrio cholerae]|nr:death on curing protein, Doc toxin [Vibrio cholerae]
MKHLSLVYMMVFYRMPFGINAFRYLFKWKGGHQKHTHNKRLKRDCQRVAFPVPLSRGGYGCCV